MLVLLSGMMQLRTHPTDQASYSVLLIFKYQKMVQKVLFILTWNMHLMLK